MDPIPTNVRRFLHTNIESVDQLEVLRLLGSDPPREFSADELNKERHLPLEQMERHIKALHGRGLLTITSEKPLQCKFGARSPELEAEVQGLVQTYIERPVTIIRMLYEHADQLKSFAEAFRLRGEK